MDAERGPFRTPEPTREAHLAREREASFERVRIGTEAAIEAQRRRERRHDQWALVFLGVAVLAAVGVAGLVAISSRVGAPLTCPAGALVLMAILTVVYRRRVGGR